MKNNLIKTLGIALIAIVLGSGMAAAAHVGSHGAAYMTPDGLAELKSGDLTGDYTVWNDHDTQHHKTVIVNVDGVDYEITYKVAGNSGAKIVGVTKIVNETPEVNSVVEPSNPGDDEVPGDSDTETGSQTESHDAPAADEAHDASDSESKAIDLPEVPKNDVVIPTPVKPNTEAEPTFEPGNEVIVAENETVENATVNHDMPQPNPDEKYVMVTGENNTEHASGDDVTVAPAANNTVANNTVENATANNDVTGIVMQNAGNPYVLLVIAIFLLIGAVAYNKRH